MREAKGLHLFIFRLKEKRAEREVEFAEGGRIFWERLLHGNRGTLNAQKSRWFTFIYCWYFCTEIEGEVRSAFIAPYGLHLIPEIGVRPVVRPAFNVARISRYGCTVSKVRLHRNRGTAAINFLHSFRGTSSIYLARFSRKYGWVFMLYGQQI